MGDMAVGDMTGAALPLFVFIRLAALTLSLVGGGGRATGSTPPVAGLGTDGFTGDGDNSSTSGDVGAAV